MRQFNIFRGTKGWLSMYESVIRFRYMRNQQEVERRVKILGFWETHGVVATKDAFGVSRRTLFRWKAVLNRSQGKLPSLDPKSTAPKKRNVRRIRPELEERIVALRLAHHRLGKRKLAPILRAQGFVVSTPYIGRCICDLKQRGVLPKYGRVSLQARTGKIHERTRTTKPKIRRPKQNKKGLEIDTVVRFAERTKRYIYTAIDIKRKFAFAGAYTRHSSETAADFLEKLVAVAPFTIDEIQTDNGSEFACLFHDMCVRLDIRHYHTYPRCPKMNGTVERFNRTLSEDFIQHHLLLLRDNVLQFNETMIDWLLWYNAERPHESLSLQSPLQCIVASLPEKECQMWWARTSCCQFLELVYNAT